MTDIEQRAYFAVGPACDDSNFLTGSAVRGRVRIAASPVVWLTPKEARQAAANLVYAARAAEADAGG